MNRNYDAVCLDNDCDVAVKTEIKSETPVTEDVMQIKFETVTCSSNWEIKTEAVPCSNNQQIDGKTEIGQQALVSEYCSQNKGEFLPVDSEIQDKKYNCDHEMVNKIEIKAEPWWLETEPSSVYDDSKNGDFLPVKSSRLTTISGANNGKSPMSSAEVSGRYTRFYNEKDHLKCDHEESDVTLNRTVEVPLSEQSDKCRYEGERLINSLHLKPRSLNYKEKKPLQCKICDKSFTKLSSLRDHILIHEGKKPHQCQICNKSFTQLSNLKTHILIHEGKKSHLCNTCNKSFTHQSSLRNHILIHEDNKANKCETCGKSFTRLSGLRNHILIHEGKKRHECKSCDKRFTRFSDLRNHILIHEGKKPHQCKTCDKRFNWLSGLIEHNLIHERKK